MHCCCFMLLFCFLLWWWRFEVNQEAWSGNNASVLFGVTLLMCVLNICGSSGVWRPDSPSLLLQEKPKQSRNTSTREIHIRATDALADLVNTGGSSESDKPQTATDKASRAIQTRCKQLWLLQLTCIKNLDYCVLNSNLTLGIQFLQVRWATDWLHYPRLVHCTLHRPTLLPLVGAQSIIASGSVGPIRVLLSGGGLREDCAILKPGHRHFLWVETLHITVKGERNVVGVRGQDRKCNRREIWEDKQINT